MREIKFRGLREQDNKFSFGNLAYHQEKPVIVNDVFEDGGYDFVFNFVITESVSQFTGLTDKNGTEIYEGDILEVVYYNHSTPNTKLTQQVYYSDEDSCFCVKTIGKEVSPITEDRNNVPLYYTHQPNTIKIIGNIHENPELMK